MNWDTKLQDIAAKTKYPIGDGDHGQIKPSHYSINGIPYIRVADIGWDGELIRDKMVFISNETHKANLKSLLLPGDIVISKTGATIGKVAIIPDDIHEANTTSSVGKLTLDKKKAFPRFVFWCMKSSQFQNQMWRVSKKSAQPGFNIEDLKGFCIPLPQIEVQQHIATILDHSDSIRRKNKQILEKYNELAQSVFFEMFGDLRTNPKGWSKIRLGDLGKLSSGSTPSREKHDYYSGNIPWIKTGEVNGNLILDTEEKITQSALNNSSCKVYPKGSIIIAMYGQGITRGKVAILGIDATTNQACAVIPPNNVMDSNFLFSYLKMAYENIREMGRGGNQPNLNVGMLKDFEIFNPPQELQVNFSELISKIESQKHLSEQSLQKSEDLFQSLLQRAFKGEL